MVEIETGLRESTERALRLTDRGRKQRIERRTAKSGQRGVLELLNLVPAATD